MFLTICMCSRRNAIGDGYKNFVNCFRNKEKIVCIVPSSYKKEEFSSQFNEIILDPVSDSKRKLFAAVKFLYSLKQIIFQKNIKTIYIYMDNHWFNSILCCFFRGMKYVVWIHDPKLHDGERKNAKLIRKLNSWLFFPYISKYIVSYNEAKLELKEFYNIDEKKIFVVYLPELLEMEYEKIVNKSTKIKYDLIFFGRIEKYKGIDLLIDTVGKMEDLTLLVVGRGQEEKNINEKVKKYKNITFINEYVENQVLAEYICESCCVILPYINATGSQTVQVANYYKKPVIVNSVGSFKEYVEHNQNGYIMRKYTQEELMIAIRYVLNQEFESIEKVFRERFSIQPLADKLFAIIKA